MPEMPNTEKYAGYYPRLQTPTGSKAYCIGHNFVGLNADQGGNTVVGGNTINSALRRKCCGGNSLTLLRPRWRCAIIVLHLRVSTALATFLRLLYPLTRFLCSSRISRHFCLEARCDYRFIYRNAEAQGTRSRRGVFYSDMKLCFILPRQPRRR